MAFSIVADAAHVAELLTKNSVLHTLILSGMHKSLTTNIFDAVFLCSSLADNFIGPTGALPLFKALERNTTLTALHLAWNNIGVGGLGQGSTAVAKMIETNTVCSCACSLPLIR